MKKILLLLLILALPALFGGCANVVATVNGQAITQKELDTNLEQTGGKQMLESLITQKLVEQDAKTKQVDVSDAEVEKQLDEVKKTLAPLDQQQLAGDKLDTLKKQIRFNLLLEKTIMSTVTDADRKAYYEKNQDILPEVELSAILVADPKQAKAILNDLQRNVPFAAEANQFSLDPTGRQNGGYVGYISKGSLQAISPDLAKAAFSLNPGQVSSPIKTQKGYYVLKVLNKRDHYDDLKDEIDKQMAAQRVKTYLQNLRDTAKVDYKGEFAKQ